MELKNGVGTVDEKNEVGKVLALIADRPLISFYPSRYLVTTFRDLHNGSWLSAVFLKWAGLKLDNAAAELALRRIVDGALSRIVDVAEARGTGFTIELGSRDYKAFVTGAMATRMARLDEDEAILMAKALALEIMEQFSDKAPIPLGTSRLFIGPRLWRVEIL